MIEFCYIEGNLFLFWMEYDRVIPVVVHLVVIEKYCLN